MSDEVEVNGFLVLFNGLLVKRFQRFLSRILIRKLLFKFIKAVKFYKGHKNAQLLFSIFIHSHSQILSIQPDN